MSLGCGTNASSLGRTCSAWTTSRAGGKSRRYSLALLTQIENGALEPPSAGIIVKQLDYCNKLLKRCLKASSEAPESTLGVKLRLVKQAGCLYEVQAFCHHFFWPAGLMKKVFYHLYEADIVFEDAYGVWLEDVNDPTPGKDNALFQARG